MLFGIWTDRMAPWMFHHLKFWWADRMILACAYKDQNNNIVIIYRPALYGNSYVLTVSSKNTFFKRKYKILKTEHQPIFKGRMYIIYLPKITSRNYLIKAKNWRGDLYSKVIEQQNFKTLFQKSNFRFILKNNIPVFFWGNPKDKNFWFSFLTIEDENNKMISGIYTKEESWQFGDIKKIPYYIHDFNQLILILSGAYKATLYTVNRFNWVTHISNLNFSL